MNLSSLDLLHFVYDLRTRQRPEKLLKKLNTKITQTLTSTHYTRGKIQFTTKEEM